MNATNLSFDVLEMNMFSYERIFLWLAYWLATQ